MQKSMSKMNYNPNLNGGDAISEYSKLESIHTRRESENNTDRKLGALLTDRKIEKQSRHNLIKSMDKGATSARGNNIAATSFRDLL